VSGFCERAVATGLPISRALVLIDTLHPVYEGRLIRWGHYPSQPVVHEYGRTGLPEGVSDLHPSSGGEQTEVVARWRASPFFRRPGTAPRSPIASTPSSGSATCAASHASPTPRPSR